MKFLFMRCVVLASSLCLLLFLIMTLWTCFLWQASLASLCCDFSKTLYLSQMYYKLQGQFTNLSILQRQPEMFTNQELGDFSNFKFSKTVLV